MSNLPKEIEKFVYLWSSRMNLDRNWKSLLLDDAIRLFNLSIPKEEEKTPKEIVIGWDEGVLGGDKSCKVYGYRRNGKTYITKVEHLEQEAKQPIEKIEPLDTKLMEEYRNKDKEDVVVNIIGNKLVEVIDTVNKQQEQINYLLSKQH